MNRALSIRSNNRGSGNGTSTTSHHHSSRRGFSLSSLRGTIQPELSKKLYRLIKSENNLISAHETAAKERLSIAQQLSEWGEQTSDEGISDISDKVGVILSELGEQEDNYAHALDESRGTLKAIRNTEKSVQPSRDGKNKIADEIAKLKSKEPESTRLVVLEQELVRAEAENLVAEAQLSNITRQKLKEAYTAEFLATIERAEKQVILARHGLRLLNLLDDTPIVPGDSQIPYTQGHQARQILNDAEDDLREWRPATMASAAGLDEDAKYVTSNSPPPQGQQYAQQSQASQPRAEGQHLQEAQQQQAAHQVAQQQHQRQQLNEKEVLDGASLTGTETNTTGNGSVVGGAQEHQVQMTAA
ncbi:Eisosome component PIL1-domain-containing protein [Pseudoneurospora amorphoporcata]|uniref:Eisosome component PIL1-domain-containing protein n=1 Tax=Pseudoneurospora amorphoporcata TaxID=241081 RepID=A0AAN6P3G2_9PEZI|nr:Eisosome component PIL1-domain-containing protein [Pseudoneurospora amorphoporcata]